MPSGKCVFNTDWLLEEDNNKWLAQFNGDRHFAYCKVCCRKFSIASMGKTALKSHKNGATHIKRMKDQTQSVPVSTLLNCNTGAISTSTPSSTSTLSTESLITPSAGVCATGNLTVERGPCVDLHHLSTLSKKVTDAELLWLLNCVSCHFSAASNVGVNALFKKMFSDSEIASRYSMSESKFRYLTTFGLGPYYQKLLVEGIKSSPAHCILFDESLNEQLQNKQLDVHARFWSDNLCQVESRYYNSLFIGHGRADDILGHYSEAVKDLDSSKTWQIGMDGPNVNVSFHNKVVQQRKQSDLPCLLDIGTCGLHTIHRAFQTGAKGTEWNLDQYLLKEYKLFKDSPARREDFVAYTGSATFPSKFCNHR